MRTLVLLLTLGAAALNGAPQDQKDVENARPNGKPMLLDLHVPNGPGPFPAAILVHGGGFDQSSLKHQRQIRAAFGHLISARDRVRPH